MGEKIVFLATAWGARYGGINSFNEDLCSALAKLLDERYHVVCVVLDATQDEIRSAKEKGIDLIKLDPSEQQDKFEENRVYEVLKKVDECNSEKVLWWIGHDIITGRVAIKASELSNPAQCAVIHHMNYEAYISYKDGSNEEARNKIEQQREFLSQAHLVFAVGPKLAESAREKISGKNTAQVIELRPGLAEIEGLDHQKRFSAITYGRLDPRNDRVKQARLVVAAFGFAKSMQLDPLGPDASLTVVGLSEDNQQEEYHDLLKLAESKANRAVPIHGWPYIDDRNQLFDHLRRHSVCLMVSLHEGFGLVGLEAIAAEVPLIVSKNSGLYETIDKMLGGVGTGCLTAIDLKGSMVERSSSYRDEDVESISEALISIRKSGTKAKEDARNLKKNLECFCTWQQTALTLAEACKIEVTNPLATVNLERWQPDVLIDGLKNSPDIVDNASRRKNQFQQIWDKMKAPSGFTQILILFGGIASALCDKAAADRYVAWLKINPDAKLYICYESGPAALARARKLDERTLETASGLPADAEKRMIMKEKKVLALKDLLFEMLRDSSEIVSRIHFIPLREALTTYIMITDNDIFITPLLEIRATETLSFALAHKPVQFRLDVFTFLIYHLTMLESSDVAPELINLLKKKKREEMNDNQ